MTENDTKADEVDEVETEAPLTARAAALDAEKAEADAKTDAQLVAERTADTDKAATSKHVKVFVVPPGNKPGKDYDHEPNIAATRQYMISQGLRPTGEVVYKGAEPHLGREAMGWDLTYEVPAVPAERFDFQPVYVPQGDGGAEGEAPAERSGNAGTEGDGDEAPKPPTMSSNRKTIDEWGAGLTPPIDTTGAATKREALALLGLEPAAE